VKSPVLANQAEYNHAVRDETPKRQLQKLRDENSRKLRQLMVQLGESLLRSRGVELPVRKVDRERIALIEAYKDNIRSTMRELENWKQFRDRATSRGMLKQAQFRQQMITKMESQLSRDNEELQRLRSIPGSFWAGST
jgi:hypothetical protein